MLKSALIVQARLASSRLPYKSALTLANGASCIANVARRLQSYLSSRKMDMEIVIACPHNEKEYFKAILEKENVKVFGGDANNLAKRFHNLLEELNIQSFVRVTGDNPFVCFDVLDYLITTFANTNKACVSLYPQKLLPNGTVISMVSKPYLELVLKEACPLAQEHIVLSRNTSITNKIYSPTLPNELWWPEGRFCLDDLADYHYLLKSPELHTLDTVKALKNALHPRQDVGEY